MNNSSGLFQWMAAQGSFAGSGLEPYVEVVAPSTRDRRRSSRSTGSKSRRLRRHGWPSPSRGGPLAARYIGADPDAGSSNGRDAGSGTGSWGSIPVPSRLSSLYWLFQRDRSMLTHRIRSGPRALAGELASRR